MAVGAKQLKRTTATTSQWLILSVQQTKADGHAGGSLAYGFHRPTPQPPAQTQSFVGGKEVGVLRDLWPIGLTTPPAPLGQLGVVPGGVSVIGVTPWGVVVRPVSDPGQRPAAAAPGTSTQTIGCGRRTVGFRGRRRRGWGVRRAFGECRQIYICGIRRQRGRGCGSRTRRKIGKTIDDGMVWGGR